MTDLYLAAADAVEMVITWLIPLDGDVGPQRYAGQPMPYVWVNEIDGVDDKITETTVLSVHTFGADYWSARAHARTVHRRMLALAPPMTGQKRVTLADGRIVYADSVETEESPTWRDYGQNDIFRFTARYSIDVRML